MFCPTWRAVLKMFATFFRIKQVLTSLEKSLAWAVYKSKKNEDTETKKVLGDLKMPKLEEIFTSVAIAWHCHARLAVLKIFARSICFELVKALRNFWEKLSTSKIKKKRRSREETLRFLLGKY